MGQNCELTSTFISLLPGVSRHRVFNFVFAARLSTLCLESLFHCSWPLSLVFNSQLKVDQVGACAVFRKQIRDWQSIMFCVERDSFGHVLRSRRANREITSEDTRRDGIRRTDEWQAGEDTSSIRVGRYRDGDVIGVCRDAHNMAVS